MFALKSPSILLLIHLPISKARRSVSDGGLFYSRDGQDRAGSAAQSKQNTDTDMIPVLHSAPPLLLFLLPPVQQGRIFPLVFWNTGGNHQLLLLASMQLHQKTDKAAVQLTEVPK